MYRGSKPDKIGEKEAENLENLGIKCIVDLRPSREWSGAAVAQPVDHKFTNKHEFVEWQKSEPKFRKLEQKCDPDITSTTGEWEFNLALQCVSKVHIIISTVAVSEI